MIDSNANECFTDICKMHLSSRLFFNSCIISVLRSSISLRRFSYDLIPADACPTQFFFETVTIVQASRK